MNLDLLVEDLVDSEEARDRRMLDKLHTVQSECHHLEEILDAFLQFARVGSLELLPVNLQPTGLPTLPRGGDDVELPAQPGPAPLGAGGRSSGRRRFEALSKPLASRRLSLKRLR